MAISVVPNSVKFVVTGWPDVTLPYVEGTDMIFDCRSGISFHGECQITGSAGDDPGGWTLGMIQLKWISTDWSFYRGQFNNDGSLLAQAARPPARPTQNCRDTVVPGAIFVDNDALVVNKLGCHVRTIAKTGSPLPLKMTSDFFDSPERPFPLTRTNRTTGKTNFIREAQTEAHYCTVLSLMSPAGTVQPLKTVYWYVHWQGRFQPTDFSNLSAPWTIQRAGSRRSNKADATGAVDGGPADPRFAAIMTSASAPNCNAVAAAAFASPNLRESNIWATFDVNR